MARVRAALLACALLAAGVHAGAEEIFYSDARMIEANSLISDRNQYAHAIALYRDVLDEFPSHATARLWLARVLSWKGDHDASLAEYDRLLELEPPADDIDVERAEVLSWAGRYDEALLSFDRILEERPESRRAMLGKARTYMWSGRRADAAKSYEQVLALGEDVETRRELVDLRKSLGAGGDARGRHYFDSDGFERTSVLTTAGVDLTFDTRFVADLAFERVGRSGAALITALGAPTSSNGLSGLAGLERRIAPEVVVRAQLGYAWWESAPGQFLARASIDATLKTNTALGLQLDHGGFLPWSNSYEALYAGIDATNLRGSAWQGLTDRWSAFGYLETTFIGDGNQRVALGGSTDYHPFEQVDLAVGVAADFLTYTGGSLLYYAPSVDVGATAFGRIHQPLRDWMQVFAELSVGMGFAEDTGLEGFGLTYGVTGGAKVTRGRFELEVSGGRSQSQRASVYTSYHAGASLNWVF